jgi:signal transduction histidine kinase
MEIDPKAGVGRRTRDSQHRVAPIVEPSPLPVVELQGSTHVVSDANPAFCELLGKSRAEMVGKSFAEIALDGDECLPILDQAYQTGEVARPSHNGDRETSRPPCLYATWPALDPSERPTGVIIELTKADHFHRDAAAINGALLISGLHQHELTAEAVELNARLANEITERKLAESALQTANRRLADQAGELKRLVAERTEKLRETVADLEGFSYSVAHDMRAPLRGMQGFAQILLDEHADQLDATARSYLDWIASSAVRMDLLIQDVLNYTRVMRSEALLASVDLDKLIRDIIATYPKWQPPKAVIQIEGPLPSVLGHEGFLTQCVSNVLSNAVKFVAPGVTPHIRIWAEERSPTPTPTPWPPVEGKPAAASKNEEPVIWVWFEDNGIGIAASDRSRIFRMFERINPADKFEGTGIGLTIVRKAIQRLGGRIDFESEPGKGSKFWMELRKAPTLTTPSTPK